MDLIKKQNQETKRTGDFLKFALGSRSPEKPHQYFKSKYHIGPEGSRVNTTQGHYDNNSRSMIRESQNTSLRQIATPNKIDSNTLPAASGTAISSKAHSVDRVGGPKAGRTVHTAEEENPHSRRKNGANTSLGYDNHSMNTSFTGKRGSGGGKNMNNNGKWAVHNGGAAKRVSFGKKGRHNQDLK